ncbi:hypothetical protein BGW38_002984 [Lunasporangiospora selenospora]|uniref:AB hydrolase-1 domain-containing protein n=1 Tax=Lunasporangiospora selenospora TaxID=979761 RepID=A0A9P6FRU4_9FUNG|nr:hypothetical protein BGW38_002984 [Lunasporangiospora selenospora]
MAIIHHYMAAAKMLLTATLALSGAQAAAIQKRASSGYNDFDCKPSAAHPRPVILIHGTACTSVSWIALYPKLVKEGYCVFAPDYGQYTIPFIGGTGPINESAVQVGKFAEKVLRATGATQADFVGHSQGGLIARYWSLFLGGEGKIGATVGIAATTHGTTLSGFTTLLHETGTDKAARPVTDLIVPSLAQQSEYLDFYDKLNAKGDSLPNVRQFNIATRTDLVVTPTENAFQYDNPDTVNVILQDLCPADLSGHAALLISPVVHRWVMNQLDPSNAKDIDCRGSLILPV